MYVAGDCTRAYSSKKMGCFTRQIVFLRPDTFVIFDRVQSKNPDFKKTWLLQAMKSPSRTDKHLVITNGNGSTGSPSRAKSREGRLFVQTLLPENPAVRLVSGSELYSYGGGEAVSALRPAGILPAVENKGKMTSPHYPPSHNTGPAPECRIEVSPSKPSSWDYFLHVLTAAGSDTDSIETAEARLTNEEVVVSVGKTKIKFNTAQIGCRVDVVNGNR
jgi:heparin/heparan-sulfate lyase